MYNENIETFAKDCDATDLKPMKLDLDFGTLRCRLGKMGSTKMHRNDNGFWLAGCRLRDKPSFL